MAAMRVVLAAFLALLCGLPRPAAAETYPLKPIRIIVAFAAGGITDILARALAQRMTEKFGQQVVVENKLGGNGFVGTEYVAKAAPDGYTLLVGADASFVFNPFLYSKLPYDPVNDFIPISGLGISPQALVVHPSVPANTLAELIALGKAKPGELNYGTFGAGTSGHLNIILMEQETGAKFTAVHYRGAAPAITDLLGGHIQMMIVAAGLLRQNIDAGKLKLLAVGSKERLTQYPNTPSISETIPSYEAGSWYGLVAPKGTPREITDKLSAETQTIFADPTFREKFLDPAMTFSIASPPDQFTARIERDLAKWGKVIPAAGIKIE